MRWNDSVLFMDCRSEMCGKFLNGIKKKLRETVPFTGPSAGYGLRIIDLMTGIDREGLIISLH